MTAPADELLRPADVEARYGVAEGTLKGWRREWRNGNHVGPAWFPLGPRRIVYRRSEVERWIAECETVASA